MDLEKEKRKKNIFFALQILFAILTLFSSALCIFDILNDVIYTIISMLISLIFGALFRNSKKAIEENSCM